MKTVKLSQFGYDLHFKKVTTDELKAGGSFSLVDENGFVVGYFMAPISGEKRYQLEALGSQMNAALGID